MALRQAARKGRLELFCFAESLHFPEQITGEI